MPGADSFRCRFGANQFLVTNFAHIFLSDRQNLSLYEQTAKRNTNIINLMRFNSTGSMKAEFLIQSDKNPTN
jgi:hypothetical protein